MKQHKDHAIILARVDYSERDRILTLLCERQGKTSVLAKGVRGQKSRLAGGIELLSESEVTFIEGKSSLRTLTGARLSIHFSQLAKDVNRMQMAFLAIKTVNDLSEEGSGQEYYRALLAVFAALNDEAHDPLLVDIWFNLYVLRESGSEPNLLVDEEAEGFEFNYDSQQFEARQDGAFKKNDLKLLRVCMQQPRPPKISRSLGSEQRLQSLVQSLVKMSLQ